MSEYLEIGYSVRRSYEAHSSEPAALHQSRSLLTQLPLKTAVNGAAHQRSAMRMPGQNPTPYARRVAFEAASLLKGPADLWGVRISLLKRKTRDQNIETSSRGY